MTFSPNVILQLHSMIHCYLPSQGGRWEMADNEIVERKPYGQIVRVRFRPVAAAATSEAMERLTANYTQAVTALGSAAT